MDPFGTAALRAAVLAAWAASPTRFREDANAEEDLRLGGYARTWLVELAQNAADAARAAGFPGRLRVVLDGDELRVANTGAPLDAGGVAALASLRASAKRDVDSVGRFGVGFAAVLALSDEPRVVSTAGGVAFSAARTAAEVRALAGPAAELARRGGQLPILRLVWPVEPDEPPPPDGYDTEVRLPLRPGVDPQALLEGARAEADTLLLALPDLVEIAVGTTVLHREDQDAATRAEPGATTLRTAWLVGRSGDPAAPDRSGWLLARRTGVLDTAQAAGLAAEQRGRVGWSVCWALPLGADGRPEPVGRGRGTGDDGADAGEVLHAPTGTSERLSLPARLVATVPLEPDRRHVRPGPATERVLAAAAAAYVDLVRAVAPADRLALVPEAGFPRSEIDGRVRELVLAALAGAAWLPGAGGTDLAPDQAEWLDLSGAEDPALPALLARCGAFPRLLARLPRPPAALGVDRLAPAALADRLLGIEMPPSWWHDVYAALAPAVDTVPGLADELRALPVPLISGPRSPKSGHELHTCTSGPTFDDHGGGRAVLGRSGEPGGRTVPGPASVLLPRAPASPAVEAVGALGLPGLHVADPAAVHPLLRRLGAEPADPAALLAHPAVVAAVERSVDDADTGLDPCPLADAVLGLLAEAGPGAASAQPAALALPDTGGGARRADELMLPDAALGPLLAGDAPLGVLDEGWAGRFPRAVLTAAGVVDGFAVLVDDEPAGPDHDLDDEESWWDSLDPPPARLLAVRDLDLVADDAWPAALALLAADRDTRAAVLAPRSYPAWWLARHARLGGHRPGHWRLPSATALAALYDPVPVPAAWAPTGSATVRVPAAATTTAPLPGADALDDAFLTAVGVRADLDVVDSDAAADLLARLADPARRPDPALTARAHAALADAVADGRVDPADLEPPRHVRALDGRVVDVEVAVVLDAPWLAAVLPAAETVAGGDPRLLAELLDLPLASDVVAADVEGAGRPVRWSDLAEVVLACEVLDVEVPAGELRHHDRLAVVVTRPAVGRREIPAWRDTEGRWHAADPVRALLGALAVGHGDDAR